MSTPCGQKHTYKPRKALIRHTILRSKHNSNRGFLRRNLGGAPHGSNGRSFHTVFLLLDFLACFVLLLVLFIVYLCIGRTPHAPDDEHIIEHRRQWYNFADTVTAFYCTRGIGLLIDVLFRVWEKSFDVPAGKVDDNLRRLHRNMLVCKEWAVAFGRLASMGLFIGLLWGKVGWWSRSVVKDWNDHHLKDDWVNIWN